MDSTPAVFPRVKRIVVCDDATFDAGERQWNIRGPWVVRFLPPGKSFPFRKTGLAVYIQLSGGLGSARLGIEMRQKRFGFRDVPDPDHDFQIVYRQVGVHVEEHPFLFPLDDSRLTIHETAIRMARVPFREEGVYEFRAIAVSGETHRALDGLVAEVSLLDPTRRL